MSNSDTIRALDEDCKPNWTAEDEANGLVEVCPGGCIPGQGFPGCPCPFGCEGTGLIADYRDEVAA